MNVTDSNLRGSLLTAIAKGTKSAGKGRKLEGQVAKSPVRTRSPSGGAGEVMSPWDLPEEEEKASRIESQRVPKDRGGPIRSISPFYQ